ncbi:hypothetical protein E2562_013600 [Oryza meyeriana var. granulata]|uniref:Uncharacterized protein n=1 Tax=Oryza meyeriana var. granulata TaxID=110450 RepID=A0A6G1C4B7_9ORYZ|nr:hypothetical protein E2562_013600 [Oryza meyeriana var. granulata]
MEEEKRATGSGNGSSTATPDGGRWVTWTQIGDGVDGALAMRQRETGSDYREEGKGKGVGSDGGRAHQRLSKSTTPRAA